MPTISPPPNPIPAPPPQQGPSLPTIVLSKPPPGLESLSPGSRFEGIVQVDGGKTFIQIQTSQGTVDIQTVLPLSKGSRLDLMLQMLAPRFQAHILTIDGKAPTGVLRSAVSATSSSATSTSAPGTTGTAPVVFGATTSSGPAFLTGNALIGATITATLTRPAFLFQAATIPSPLRGNIATTPTSGTSTPPAAGTGQAAPSSSPPPPATMGLTASAQPSRSPGSPSSSATSPSGQPHPAGTLFPARVLTIAPAPAGQPLPAPTAGGPAPVLIQGQTLSGIVSGTSVTGQAIVHTPAGPLALSSPAPIPSGTTVSLEITGNPIQPRAADSAVPPASPRSLLMTREFPAIEDALRAIQEANPNVAQQIAQTAIPRPDAQLGATMLFFLSALRVGDVRSWLGDPPLRILERAKPGAVKNVTEEFRQISRMAREPVTADWRVALIPMQTGEGLDQIRLMLRPDDGRSSDDAENGAGTRFVIDLTLSRLDRVQLDGLVRDNGKRVDLIIRTAGALSQEMRDDIRRIFREANETTGIDGDVVFQVGPGAFVEIEPDKLVEMNGDVVV